MNRVWCFFSLVAAIVICLCGGRQALTQVEPEKKLPDEEGASSELAVLTQAPVVTDHWLTLFSATVSFNEGLPQFQVEGATSLPDASIVDFSMEQRDYQSPDIMLSVSVQRGIFGGTLVSPRKILPGYYVIRASFSSMRQLEFVQQRLAAIIDLSSSYPVAVGNPEDIEKAKAEAIKAFEADIAMVTDKLEHMRRVYKSLLGGSGQEYRPDEAVALWDKEFKTLPETVRHVIDRYYAQCAKLLFPPLPNMSHWVIICLRCLESGYEVLRNGLAEELTPPMIAKGWVRETFLDQYSSQLGGQLCAVRTQFKLEQTAALRDEFAYAVSQLAWLLEVSRHTFSVLMTIEDQNRRMEWRRFVDGWRKTLTPLSDKIKDLYETELTKIYPALKSQLGQAPSALEQFWRLCDRVMLEKTPYSNISVELDKAYEVAFTNTVPVVEVLGFDRVVYNKQMEEMADVTGRVGSPEWTKHAPPPYRERPQVLDIEPAKIIGDIPTYLRRKIEDLRSHVHTTRVTALQILVSFGKQTEPLLRACVMASDPSMTQRAMCTIALVRIGDMSLLTDVAALVQANPDESIRALAVSTLAAGIVNTPLEDQYVALLAKVLKSDTSALVRQLSAAALGGFERAACVDTLIEALEDESEAVRGAAKYSIDRITKTEWLFQSGAGKEARKGQIQAMTSAWTELRSTFEK